MESTGGLDWVGVEVGVGYNGMEVGWDGRAAADVLL